MIKKFFKLLVLILVIVGIILGVRITLKREIPEIYEKEIQEKIFSMIQTKSVEATKFYTYGRTFNIEGKFPNVSKDNFESVKLVVTDGKDYPQIYTSYYKELGDATNADETAFPKATQPTVEEDENPV